MSEGMKDNLECAPGATAQNALFEHPLNTSDWEKRLSEARAQREKVLSKRTEPPSKPGFNPTALTGKTAKCDAISEPVLNAVVETPEQKPEVTSEVNSAVLDDEEKVDASELAFVSRRNATPEMPQKSQGFQIPGWLKVTGASKPLYLVMCSVGLGFGLALGFGFLLGLGWPLLPNGQPTAGQLQSEAVLADGGTVVQSVPVIAVAPIAQNTSDTQGVTIDLPELPVPQWTAEASSNITLPNITPIAYLSSNSEDGFGAISALPVIEAPQQTASKGGEEPDASAMYAQALQFFVHAPESVSDKSLEGYIAQLEDTGFPVARIGRESVRVSATHLRFYSPQNADVARAIAANLGVEAKDFSQDAGNSSRIEVWLAGASLEAIENEKIAERSNFFSRWLESRQEER